LLKDPAELEAAYDDALGVTAAFDLNLLLHINRLVGSNFAVRDWRHLSRFNAAQSRVEMHLQARHAVTVQWPGGQRQFAASETIHTENACKWTCPNFESCCCLQALPRSARVWTDPKESFCGVLGNGLSLSPI
jgi:L-histidine Nalpha-methyltransferase